MAPVMAAADAGSVSVNTNGKISVAAEAVPLPVFMQRLAEVAGFECRGCSGLQTTPVNADYVNTDLKTVLSDVLAGTGFLLEHSEIGQIRRVLILHEASPDYRRAGAGSDASVYAGMTPAEREGFEIAHRRVPPDPNERDFRIRQTASMRAYGPGGRAQRIKQRVVMEDPQVADDEGVFWGPE